MTAAQLIEQLQHMPSGAIVGAYDPDLKMVTDVTGLLFRPGNGDCQDAIELCVAVPVNAHAELTMENQKVVKLTSFDLPPRLITSINAFDDAMVKAIDTVIESGVHRGMIVGMLHAYAHEQTRRMVEDGYA